VKDLCLTYSVDNYDRTDVLSVASRAIAETGSQLDDFLRTLFYAFYRTGFVGIRNNSFEAVQWSFLEGSIVTPSSISTDSKAFVHPMYYRVLGISPRGDTHANPLSEIGTKTA
jgi:hypothetical protein